MIKVCFQYGFPWHQHPAIRLPVGNQPSHPVQMMEAEIFHHAPTLSLKMGPGNQYSYCAERLITQKAISREGDVMVPIQSAVRDASI